MWEAGGCVENSKELPRKSMYCTNYYCVNGFCLLQIGGCVALLTRDMYIWYIFYMSYKYMVFKFTQINVLYNVV